MRLWECCTGVNLTNSTVVQKTVIGLCVQDSGRSRGQAAGRTVRMVAVFLHARDLSRRQNITFSQVC